MPTDFVSFTIADPGEWQAAHSYGLLALARPVTPNGLYYESQGGAGHVSGPTEPTWPLVVGETVVDGAVTWECLGALPMLGVAPIITESSGTDADTPQAQGTPLNMLAQWVHWIVFNMADVNTDNEWSGENQFAGLTVFDGETEFFSANHIKSGGTLLIDVGAETWEDGIQGVGGFGFNMAVVNISQNTPSTGTELFGTGGWEAPAAPTPGFYRFELYCHSDSANSPTVQLVYNDGISTNLTTVALTDLGASGSTHVYVLSIPVVIKAGALFDPTLHFGSGNVDVMYAALTAIA